MINVHDKTVDAADVLPVVSRVQRGHQLRSGIISDVEYFQLRRKVLSCTVSMAFEFNSRLSCGDMRQELQESQDHVRKQQSLEERIAVMDRKAEEQDSQGSIEKKKTQRRHTLVRLIGYMDGSLSEKG